MNFRSSIDNEPNPEVREAILRDLEGFGVNRKSHNLQRQTIEMSDIATFEPKISQEVNVEKALGGVAIPHDVTATVKHSDDTWLAWKGLV